MLKFFEKTFRSSENLLQNLSIENVQNFYWLSHKNMPVSQTEGYVVNLEYCFSEKHAFLVGFKKETSKKKRLLVLRQIPTQILL